MQDEINIQERSINQKSNNTMSVMLYMGPTFIKKNSCLVARIVSFDTAGLHVFTFCILEPYCLKIFSVISVTYLTLKTLL